MLGFNSRLLVVLLSLVAAMVLWMGYYFYFQTDHHGHRLSDVGTPEAQAAEQRQLRRADALMQQRRFAEARQLLDSLRNSPTLLLSENELRARFDSLYQRRDRAERR